MNWLKASYVRFVARVTPRCHDMTRLLSESMDHPLPWRTWVRMQLHFTVCVWCSRYARQLRQIRTFSRMFPEKAGDHGTETLPVGSRERLKEAVRKAVGP